MSVSWSDFESNEAVASKHSCHLAQILSEIPLTNVPQNHCLELVYIQFVDTCLNIVYLW